MSRWTWGILVVILLFDLWLRGHTFGPSLHARWGFNLWPENGPTATTEPLDCDEAAYAYIGRRILHGDVLYRDLTENKPPGGYWIYALTVALGGANELAIRVMPLPFVLGTIALIWWMVRRFHGTLAAALAACIFAVVSTDPYVFANGANMEHFLNFFSVASLAALIWSSERTGAWGPVLVGALLGMACLVKQIAVIALPLYLLALALRPGRSWRSRCADVAALLGGLGGVLVLAGGVILAQGAARAAFADVVVYGRTIAADSPPDPHAPSHWVRWLTGNSDPRDGSLPWPFGRTDYLVWWGCGAWPLWLAGLVASAALLVQGVRKRDLVQLLLVFWTVAACVQVVLPGMYWPHYYMLPLPGLALVVSVAFANAWKHVFVLKRKRISGILAIVLLLAACAGTVVIQVRDYLGNAPQDLARKFKGGTQWIVLRAFGGEIARRTAGTRSPHLYVWGWQSPLFIYGKIDSPSRHFFADELIKTANRGFPNVRPETRRLLEGRLDEIMHDLESDPPQLILAGHPPFPALDRFLKERYFRSRLDQPIPDGRGLWVEKSYYGTFEGGPR